jgi:hypothetical protein
MEMNDSNPNMAWIGLLLGTLLGSGAVVAAAVALVPVYYPPHAKYEWVKAAIGATDCTAIDTGAYYRSEPPNSCLARDEGTIAICWDGKNYKNPNLAAPEGGWCTFKAISPDKCTGGGNKGIVWVYKRVPKG